MSSPLIPGRFAGGAAATPPASPRARRRRSAALQVLVWAIVGARLGAAAAGQTTPEAPTAGDEIAWRIQSLPAGDQPFEVLAADLDGDGDSDLAVTNSVDSSIGVYLSNGDGTFAGPLVFPTGEFPRGLVAADFNRDGMVDLAAAAMRGDAVAIHLGQGGGRFTTAHFAGAGQRPFHAITDDFNADGIADIAVAGEVRFVSILIGDGHGRFTSNGLTTGRWPSNVAAADFNEDRHRDFASTNWGDNNVTVLFGSGDGRHFSRPKPFTYEGHGLFGIIAADLDRDGHADMVWNDLARDSMYVLYGDGRGDFPRTRMVPAGAGNRSVRAVDLNADDWLDLVSADTAAGSMSVALADGRGGFAPTQYLPVGVLPRVVTTGDFNGDGRPDAAVTNMDSDSVSVLLQEGLAPRRAEPFDPGPQQSKRILPLEGLVGPHSIALLPGGDLAVSDQPQRRVVRVGHADGRLTLIAGTGQNADLGDGEAAVEASFSTPSGLALDPAGHLYVADFDSHRVRRVDPSGIISTVAGTGLEGFAGDGGPAGRAQLSRPYSLATDAGGALYVFELGNMRVRKVDPAGTITTVAGNGRHGYSGDGGPATAASVGLITSVAAARDGTLYLADRLHRVVRRVDRSGIITTVAGGKQAGAAGDIGEPTAITVAPDGTVYFATVDRIARLNAKGGVETAATLTTKPQSPAGIAVDAAGAIYIAGPNRRIVRFASPTAAPQVVAGDSTAPDALR